MCRMHKKYKLFEIFHSLHAVPILDVDQRNVLIGDDSGGFQRVAVAWTADPVVRGIDRGGLPSVANDW